MADFQLSSIPRGLWDAIGRPIADDFQQVEDRYPIASQAAQLAPPVGIPWNLMKYAKAYDDGKTEDAIKAALAAIPIAERSYKVGNKLAKSAEGLGLTQGLRAAMNSIGRRFAAGEQTAESAKAGFDEGSKYASQ